MGTSPGAVYETLLNLCRGSYDCGGTSCPRLGIDQVTLVRTSSPAVEFAARVARLLIHCNNQVFPGDDPRRLPCTIRSVGVIPLGFPDVSTRKDYEALLQTITKSLGRGDVVDVTGGRVAMAVGAALAPITYSVRDVMIVSTSIPQDRYKAIGAALDKIRANYDLERIEREAIEQGCQTLRKYPGLASLLRQLVTGEATTILLYP
jgi:hypothetical protein